MAWFGKKSEKISKVSTSQETSEKLTVDDPHNAEEYSKFEKEFTEEGFWDKISHLATNAGSEIIQKALQLYYTKDYCNASQKALLFGALGYLILPFDMIADIIPAIGFADDLAALAAVMKVLDVVYKSHQEEINEKVKEKINGNNSR